MAWFTLNWEGINHLFSLVIALFPAGYLLSLREKSRATWWLTGSACATALTTASLLALNVVQPLWSDAWSWNYLAFELLFSLIALGLVGFAYRFQEPESHREGGAVLATAFFVVGVLGVTGGAVIAGLVPGVPTVLDLVALVPLEPLRFGAFMWAAAVLLRKAVGVESAVVAGANRPGGPGASPGWRRPVLVRVLIGLESRRARGYRAFAAVTFFGAGISACNMAALYSIGSVFQVAFCIGLVVAVVNYSPEPTTVRAKIVGFTLAAVLCALAVALRTTSSEGDLWREGRVALPRQTAVRFVPNAGGVYVVEEGAAAMGSLGEAVVPVPADEPVEVPLGFAFPFAGRTWDHAFVGSDGYVTFGEAVYGEPAFNYLAIRASSVPTIVPLLGDFDLSRVRRRSGLYADRGPGRLTLTWNDVPYSDASGRTTVQLELNESGSFAFRYGDVANPPMWFANAYGVRGVFPAGMGAPGVLGAATGPLPRSVDADEGVVQDYVKAYVGYSNDRLLPWVWIVLGSTAGVLLGLPFLLHVGISRPIGRLLGGIRRIEEGDLAVELPVETPDEFGRVTASFNGMAGSLRAYAHEMEALVEARTAELRSAQERLVQAEKLASLGRLTAGVAHEIKNPLNFVSNFSSLSVELFDELRELLEPHRDHLGSEVALLLDDLESNAGKVHEHGCRADAIVRAMMEHARGDGEKRWAVDVNALVEERVRSALADRDGGPRPVLIERGYAADAGEVMAAPEQVGHALSNLLANALDAVDERAGRGSGEGGGVDYAPSVNVTTRREGDTVVIAVCDNGDGVAPSLRPRLFEPFATTRTTGSGHIGLGLSIAHGIVVGHGGTIEVASTEGSGSTFSVVLPRM